MDYIVEPSLSKLSEEDSLVKSLVDSVLAEAPKYMADLYSLSGPKPSYVDYLIMAQQMVPVDPSITFVALLTVRLVSAFGPKVTTLICKAWTSDRSLYSNMKRLPKRHKVSNIRLVKARDLTSGQSKSCLRAAHVVFAGSLGFDTVYPLFVCYL